MEDYTAQERPKRVLVADDDTDVCALLQVALAPLALVTLVHDAETALELVATEGPAELRLAPNDDNGAPRFSF